VDTPLSSRWFAWRGHGTAEIERHKPFAGFGETDVCPVRTFRSGGAFNIPVRWGNAMGAYVKKGDRLRDEAEGPTPTTFGPENATGFRLNLPSQPRN
jgi:hypothetical protein